nr:hypothetical protein [Candidatus Solirubrobacter pratensis]
MRRLLIAVAVIAAAGLAVGATGHAAGSATALKTRHGELGTFLVDGHGRTLYLFEKDKTSKSTCSGACAAEWPPLRTSGRPTASGVGEEVAAREDQARRRDHAGDVQGSSALRLQPGPEAKGQGVKAFGAKWYAESAAGTRIGGGY